ncbi:hypothetical protein F4824DRAFT_46876 [Ustulina deusta]|nr:hypothetical protein F4824DRAFT_46876 [Ustulina deusta]
MGHCHWIRKLYAMPGDEIVPLNSENLSPCWVLDPMRLGLSTPHVEVGPNFSAILSHSQRASSRQKNDSCLSSDQRAYDLQYGSSGWRVKSAESTLWDFLAVAEEKSSENFMSIQRYALARQFLQIGLDTRGWVDSGWETTLNRTTSFEADGTMTLNRRNTSDAPVTLDWSSNTTSKCKDYSLYGLYSKVRAVTLEEPLTQEEIANIYPYNKSAPGIAYWSLFVLNESIQLGPGVVPYNSTIRLNDSLIPLEAPFLDVGFNCSAYPKSNSFNGLGNCVCYKGKPISLDLLSDDKAICNTAPGYVWGFSSYLTRMGLILEATWMLCCFVAYPWLLYRSKLLHMEPIKSSKTIS